MTFQKVQISEEDLKKIEKLFTEKFRKTENSYLINIRNEKINSNISVEIFTDSDDFYLISVYTNNTHLQLQSCTNFVISEMLEEVIFISETETTISGLIISKQGDCALYSNVSRKILSTDFTELNSEKLLAAVALSVTEQ
ncbi:MAG: hypothetical protein KDD00_06680 [Ignavibacteriae bacterium]|nr:hypothetical protein [Ignavibacteriota bacterium]